MTLWGFHVEDGVGDDDDDDDDDKYKIFNLINVGKNIFTLFVC